MDHTEATNQLAVEKYLLGELGPEERDAFEELFFSDPEVATDLRAASFFIAQAKKELAEQQVPARIVPQKRSFFNFDWLLRPAFAVPAMAAMLFIIGYQNTWTLPRLRVQAAVGSQPQILPSIGLVDGGSRGAEIRTVTVGAHQPFLLSVDVPSQNRFSGYLCSLYSASGKMIWQLTVPPEQVSDTVSIQVPASNAEAGVNTLLVQGIPSGQNNIPVDLVRYRFLVQIR